MPLESNAEFEGGAVSVTRWKLLMAVLFGQALSLAVCLIDVVAKALDLHECHFAALLDFAGYGSLALVFLPIHYLPSQLGWWSAYSALKVPPMEEDGTLLAPQDRFLGLKVFAVAMADAGGAYTATVAYQYSVSVASVALLNSFAIPCAMLLSYFLLGARYSWRHGLSVSLALAGLVVVVLADIKKVNDGSADADSVQGDLLTLLSAALYALSNVLSEKLVKTGSTTYYLAWLGVGGALITGVQTGLFEPDKVIGAPWSTDPVVPLLFVCFAALFAAIYASVAKYLTIYDAVALNLSFLSTNVYGVLFGVMLFNEEFQWLSAVGFCFIVAGLTGYHWPSSAAAADAAAAAAAAAAV